MQKIKDSLLGIPLGILAIIAGVSLLFWNEKNNVQNLKTTKEIRDVVITVNSEKINPSNENKLVKVTGKLDTGYNTVKDPIFNMNVSTAKLERIVEMYQWTEECEDSKDPSTCKYKLSWEESLIDSSDFKNSGHNNPNNIPYKNTTFILGSAKIGAFNLSKEQLEQLPTNETYKIEKNVSGFTIQNNYYTTSNNINDPEIGDIRIYFKYNASDYITVLAKQSGENLVSYESKVGKMVNQIADGTQSAEQMISKIETADKVFKWLMRIIGYALEIIGFYLIFGPIQALTSYIPILGKLVDTATYIIAFLLGSAVSLISIGIAWLVYRPLIGITIIVIAGILIYILFSKKNKKVNNEYYQTY